VGRGKLLKARCSAHTIEATFADFLHLAGLAKTVVNKICFGMTKTKVLTVACKIRILGIEQHRRRMPTSGRKQSILYLYLVREEVGSQEVHQRAPVAVAVA
jgi:hypothetical protein